MAGFSVGDYRADHQEAVAAGLKFSQSLSRAFPPVPTPASSLGSSAPPAFPHPPPQVLSDLTSLPSCCLCPPARQRQATGGYQRAQGAEARQGRALSPSPAPPAPTAPLQLAAGVSGWSAAHRQPRGAWDGGGRRGGRPHGSELTAHFKRLWGCASLLRPGNFKAAGRLAPLEGLAAPPRPPGGHDPSAPRCLPPGSPAARRGRRALRRYDGRCFLRVHAGGNQSWSAGGLERGRRCSKQTDLQRGGVGSACWSEGALDRARRGHLTSGSLRADRCLGVKPTGGGEKR